MLEEAFELEQRSLGQNVELLDDLSLSNLRKYKYSAVDDSPVSKYILGPWWNFVVTFMPKWLAPNNITLIGFFAVVIDVLLISHYVPDLYSQGPSWIYYYASFALFFYQTMDNIDGKQARRTGTSSPLGELFDHGIDSLNCCFCGLCCVASIGLGSTVWGFVLFTCTCISMYLSTWETYYTNTLYLAFMNGPTEGMLVICFIHLITAVYGVSWWQQPCDLLWGYDRNVCFTAFSLFTQFFAHAPGCLINVNKAIRARENRDISIAEPLRTLRPLWFIMAACMIWVSSSHSTILVDNHMVLFGVGFCFTFGRTSTIIILSHLCHQSFPTNSLLLMLLYVGAFLYGVLPWFGFDVNSLLPELAYLKFYAVFSAVYFFAYSKLIIDKLTGYLGIRAFTVPSNPR